MNKKDKEEIFSLFGEAFREVILPSLEDIQEQIETRASKEDIDRLERQKYAKEDQIERLGNRVDNHEKRLEKLELKSKLN